MKKFGLLTIAVMALSAAGGGGLTGPKAKALTPTLSFPGAQVVAISRFVAVTADGAIGFSIEFVTTDSSVKLLSFSLADLTILDQIDLTSYFGPVDFSGDAPASLKLNNALGLVVVYGWDGSHAQNVVALSFDQTGRLKFQWAAPLTPPAAAMNSIEAPDLCFNLDGSRIYVIYNQVHVTGGMDVEPSGLEFRPESGMSNVTRASWPERAIRFGPNPELLGIITSNTYVLSIDAAGGQIRETAPLVDNGGFPQLFFDDQTHMLVAVVSGASFVLNPEPLSVGLRIDFRIGLGSGLFSSGLDPGGATLLSYAGYLVSSPNINVRNRSTVFAAFDLRTGAAKILGIREPFLPSFDGITFVRQENAIVAVTSAKIIGKNSSGIEVGSNIINIVRLMPDGSLQHTADVRIPRVASGAGPNELIPGCVPQVSPSGALGFIDTFSGELFAFDTLTGEIVNSLSLNPGSFPSILLVPGGSLLFDVGVDSIGVIHVDFGPSVTGVQLGKRRSVVSGSNFLSGVKVAINGQEILNPSRDTADPGHKIFIPVGKRDLGSGTATVVVTNRDGLQSQPFAVNP